MRNKRLIAMTKMLCDYPNKIYSLQYFCDRFNAAKSSISEDLKIVKETLEAENMGRLETLSGASGGVKYIPFMSNEECMEVQKEFCDKLSNPKRMLGGGFLYTSDLMFDPVLMNKLAHIFAKRFNNSGADYVATIETKGLCLATMTARLLNIPMVVIRREAKISEGPTLSINYFSGSYDRIQKMSISKNALVDGARVIIMDDFMHAGGSVKGISEILDEFKSQVVGIGVAVAYTSPEKKKVDDYCTIAYFDDKFKDKSKVRIFPNSQIF